MTTLNQHKAWNNLSMREKAAMIKVAVQNGITNLQDIRDRYNEFAMGGDTNQHVTTGGAGYVPDNSGQGAIDLVRRRLYDNVIPFGYNEPVKRIYNAVVKNQKEHYDPAYRVSADTAETLDALWGHYLQIPRERRHSINSANDIVRSAGPDNKEYYQLKNLDPIIDEVINTGLGWTERIQKNPGKSPWVTYYHAPIKLGEKASSNTQNQVLGEYQIGRGYDAKGEYLSYSDIWDINPYQKSVNLYGQNKPEKESFGDKLMRYLVPKSGDASMGIGKPVNIFGKIYLDDIYGVSEPTHATYLPEVTVFGKKHSDGGSIHIKDSKKGTFTAAATKHGMGVQEFASKVLANKDNYSPAMVRKANFARNASKWHGLGGNLFEEAGQMEIGRDYWQSQTQEPNFMEGLAEFNRQQELKKQQQRQALRERINAVGRRLAEERMRESQVESNDNAWIETPLTFKKKNPHLERKAVEGAKAHRAWEEEHPVATFAGNVLGATPLAIAAIPAAGAAIESAPTVASALAPGSAFWMNPITQQIAASTLGGKAVDLATTALTPYDSWGEGVSDVVKQTTGWNPNDSWWGSTLADMTNPGYLSPYGAIYDGISRAIEAVSPVNRAVKNTVDNIERRGAEAFMRTTPFANPLPEAENGIVSMWNGENGGRQRLAHIANYILTGKRIGPKGYYNSFARYVPLDNSTLTSNPSLAQRWKDFMNPNGTSFGYSGFVDVNGKVPKMVDRKDIIDAFLYGEEIDPSFGIRRIAIGENFGPHADYIKTKYPSKAHDIQVYEMNTPEGFSEATPVGDWKGVDKGLFGGGTEDYLNVAGHIGTKGVTSDGTSVIQRQDIWKFNPDEYFNRWLKNTRSYTEMSPRKQKLVKWGLKEVDRLGTPVISRTKWDRWGWL